MTSNNKELHSKIGLDSNVFYAGLLVLMTISILFYFLSIKYPVCCDAKYYVELASSLNLNGIDSFNEQVRTFAYPWILSHLLSLSDFFDIQFSIFVFLFQLSVYYFSILMVCRALSKYSSKASNVVYVLLCFNFYVVPYIVIALTESLHISLILIFFALVMEIYADVDRSKRDVSKLVFLLFLAFTINMVVRPAAVWLIVPSMLVVLDMLFRRKVEIAFLALLILISATPLFIQMSIFGTQFGKFTIFPIVDLGGLQIKWGIEFIKYGTWLGGGAPQNYYPSTALVNSADSALGLYWYFEHPIAAVKLLTVKFVGAFDFDYLTPYAYKRPFIPYISSFIAFAFFWTGLVSIFVHTCIKRIPALGRRVMPLLILISWGAISLSSALELRFTLPLLCYFIVISVLFFEFIVPRMNIKYKLIYGVGGVLFISICFVISDFVRSQSSVLSYVN
ncbi:hypothetical protein [Vibrio sp. F74]|uniref:hypothetical protein n=1 Tax=Vibrio sp. F74 TaxID=700020 RepID=UPI0035F5ECB0